MSLFICAYMCAQYNHFLDSEILDRVNYTYTIACKIDLEPVPEGKQVYEVNRSRRVILIEN